MNIIKKIIKTIAYIFLFALISLCLYTFIMTDLLKKDYANIFGYTYFVVSSGSMTGTIEINDVVFVKLTKDVKEKEIITYKNKHNEIITHRLMRKVGNKLILQGDANSSEDDPITKEDVIGKIVFIISPSFVLKSLAAFIIVFILLTLINFEKIFDHFIVNDKNKFNSEKFKFITSEEADTTGNFTLIPLDEIAKLENNIYNKASKKEIELLEDDPKITKKEEKEILKQITDILDLKTDYLTDSKIDSNWVTKIQYLYELTCIIKNNNKEELLDKINHLPFKEIYDYDLDEIGLNEQLRNKISNLPIYTYIKLLLKSIMYNDKQFFDGIFKMLKYNIKLDRYNTFTKVNDSYGQNQLNNIKIFIKKISENYSINNLLALENIEKEEKIKKIANN